MKVYIDVPWEARSIRRVEHAIKRYAPPGVEFIEKTSREIADLVVALVIGYPETEELVASARLLGQRYAIVQLCLRSTQRPSTFYWLPLWSGADVVWSYYDLRAAVDEDTAIVDQPDVDFSFYDAPLGADGDVFNAPTETARPVAIITTGYVADTEGAVECAEATRRANRMMVHLGPARLQLASNGSTIALGRHVSSIMGVADAALASIYRSCQYVAGLRRVEGFELPAVEGLFCGARPVMFDRPHYRRWFDEFAEFVPEGTFDETADALTALFERDARPVTSAEIALARDRFDWKRVVGGFWSRIEEGGRS